MMNLREFDLKFLGDLKDDFVDLIEDIELIQSNLKDAVYLLKAKLLQSFLITLSTFFFFLLSSLKLYEIIVETEALLSIYVQVTLIAGIIFISILMYHLTNKSRIFFIYFLKELENFNNFKTNFIGKIIITDVIKPNLGDINPLSLKKIKKLLLKRVQYSNLEKELDKIHITKANFINQPHFSKIKASITLSYFEKFYANLIQELKLTKLESNKLLDSLFTKEKGLINESTLLRNYRVKVLQELYRISMHRISYLNIIEPLPFDKLNY